ncbi:hypothetical protein, partial [Pantoea agglomerans]|uniref:hypothetical protein n=1 Tax=Enterobacter agglomerans TaxID=549 RepID=UPI001F461D1F
AAALGTRACGRRRARFQRVPSQALLTDGPLVTAHPCAGPSFHRRPGGSSWFTSLPQRSLIAASTSKQKSKRLNKTKKAFYVWSI